MMNSIEPEIIERNLLIHLMIMLLSTNLIIKRLTKSFNNKIEILKI